MHQKVLISLTGITIEDDPDKKSYLLSLRDGYPIIYELGPAELTGSDIQDALAVYPQNEWIVQLVLKEDSEQKFTDLTKKLASLTGDQRKLAIVLDSEVISAPGIALDVNPNTGITGGTAAISMGNADQGESANNLAVILRYGALPVSFERSSIQKVSATLGENTLNLGLQAGLVGLIIVSFFLLIYYRLNGVIAILGLSSFGALFYSVIALLGELQGYTLTLAGIAGVIVSIGLTADSYIVIFEKLKDELKIGRSFNFATEKAVKEAWNTILVADFVSIIASVILYILAVGPIRGFALTLGVATLFDLFYTRLFIGNAVPTIGFVSDNPRFYFPLSKKDIADV
jgi:protein-export membrane protein SecD